MNDPDVFQPTNPTPGKLEGDAPAQTIAELYEALDDLHIACECATVPEVEDWYRRDPFASEARLKAIDVLLRYERCNNNSAARDRSSSTAANRITEKDTLLKITDELERHENFWRAKQDDTCGINLAVCLAINGVRQAVLKAICEDEDAPQGATGKTTSS
jgi:hypothetical protein